MNYFYLFVFLLGCTFICTLAKEDLPGKNLFLTSKGKYGSCNFCHKNGGSVGRWDFEYEEISKDEGRIIPSLKGIGKKKSIEQIERSITYMKKLFGFKLTEEEITQIAEYVATL